MAAKGGKIPLLKSEKELEFFKLGDRHMSTLYFRGKALGPAGHPSTMMFIDSTGFSLVSTIIVLLSHPLIKTSAVQIESNRVDADTESRSSCCWHINASELVFRRDQ